MPTLSLRCLVTLGALLIATPVFAQAYPTRPINVIVPYAPGGSVDAVARIVAAKMTDRIGQNVLIENVAGADRKSTRLNSSH